MSTEAITSEEALLAEHEPRIRALVRWLWGQGYRLGSIEDMRQDARLVLLTRARKFDEEAGAELWTYARSRIIGYFKDRAISAQAEQKRIRAVMEQAPRHVRCCYRVESGPSNALLQAFALLIREHPRGAKVLQMYYVEGTLQKDIAAELGMRLTEVRQELARAQQFLRERWTRNR